MDEKQDIELHLIAPDLNTQELEWLRSFDERIFRPAFPNEDERESLFDDILPRLGSLSEVPHSYLILAVRDMEVLGGLICDWYASCHSLEIIYIAISSGDRNKGMGSKLLKEGTAKIVQAIEKGSDRVKRIYFETENPGKPQNERHFVMELKNRLRFFGKHGGCVLLENYYQPPLSETKNWADNMMLCTLPVFRYDKQGELECYEPETVISEEEVMDFLQAFYAGLFDNDKTDVGKGYLQRMRDSLLRNEAGAVVPMRIEYYSFLLPYAAVSSHFFIKPQDKFLDPDSEDRVFNSYECDLMQYGFQEYPERPMVTHHLALLRQVVMHLPDNYTYESEGNRYRVRRYCGQDLSVNISFNWSYHRKFEKYLATVVFTPSGGCAFSELDILKIIALTGFGSKQENFKALDPWLFAKDDKTKMEGIPEADVRMDSFEDLLMSVYHLTEPPVKAGTGITEIDFWDMEGEGFEGFSKLEESEWRKRMKQLMDNTVSQTPSESVFNKMLCGLFLGIFDFSRMNQGEIADTINPFLPGGDYFTQVCRGNLIQVKWDTTDERIGKILTSAYLIIPSAVLAMNERVLKDNYEALEKMSETDRKGWLKKVFMSDYDKYSELSGKIKQVETSLSSCYIRDVFQYISEQMIIKHGSSQRGLSKSLRKLQEAIDFQKSRADEFRNRYTSSIDTLQNIILLVLAILQVATIKSADEVSGFAWVAIVASLLIGAFLFFRKRNL